MSDIYKLDGWHCQNCGTPLTPWEQPTCHRCTSPSPLPPDRIAELERENETMRILLGRLKLYGDVYPFARLIEDESGRRFRDRWNAAIDAVLRGAE